ncbi:ATP-binding protein [Streptomyces sp. NRRL WC-3618]|uniref:HD domain-containing protein n=1 Tax=Streptomyces sp. NRRL WC-3618 TaxID=1519490 RepID=UPI000AB28CB8|nr:ATP-binding protein [Streptomyces sp. NRRL WC-3618]
MADALPSHAERMAQEACTLQPFREINLLGIRNNVEELLGAIGNVGIFEEYTKHDISHIDAMLESLEWIIPEETKSQLTPTDWLLTVLAIYFHDLGMLVTKDEYQQRDQSSFQRFKEDVLLTDDNNGRDYKARIDELQIQGGDVEKFLYQEFVRYFHATRVRNWIIGNATGEYGVSNTAQTEVAKVLDGLPYVFRKDLALVCESHHLDDLDNVDKYSVSKPYGTRKTQTANVQYAAILLRTVDILHVTSDRTPSITFRILNPSDPTSQLEWAKQQAVTSVRAKLAVNSEGELDPSLTPESIEVHALFTDGNAYFGLIAYLQYAEQQLRMSHEWVTRSNRLFASTFTFPWKHIDTHHIHVEGFLPRQFDFNIDREKILDLLTGHTLYNDSNVVLRELLQNSIDAVRLQEELSTCKNGKIWISWDSKTRTLEVRDNGCGMTQEIIENNLLRAGSSRYQEPDFRKKHPNFSPISRFGIGVMSAFMIADQVEVITSNPEEEEARQLELRSVHGKYLVRVLPKEEVDATIRPHGTIVRLIVRHSAEIDDILDTARRWIVVPGCAVTCTIDGSEEVRVGYDNLKESLEDFMIESSIISREHLTSNKVRVNVVEKENATIAYALRWNEFFRQWEFLKNNRNMAASRRLNLRAQYVSGRENYQRDQFSPGVCVEGVRVESTAPGYKDRNGIIGLVNVSGQGSPRTNVARSSLDDTPEKTALLGKIYEAYCDHIRDQTDLLQSENGYSLTWACSEAQFLTSSLTANNMVPSSFRLLQSALQQVPLAVVEEGGVRRKASIEEIRVQPEIHMRISNFADHVEALLREVPADVSLQSLLEFLGNADDPIPANWTLLCSRIGGFGLLEEHLASEWEIAVLSGRMDRRSCNVTWRRHEGAARWTSSLNSRETLHLVERLSMRSMEGERDIRLRHVARLPIGDVESTGFSDRYVGVRVGVEYYLFNDHPWAWAVDAIKSQFSDPEELSRQLTVLSWLVTYVGLNRAELAEDVYRRLLGSEFDISYLELKKFQESCEVAATRQIFDSSRWTRSDNN